MDSENRNNTAADNGEGGIGRCPHCGGEVLYGKYGAYCDNKCGLALGKYYGQTFTEDQIRDLLAGKQVLMSNQKGKNGKTFDVLISIEGEEEFSYEKDGQTFVGYGLTYTKEFVKKPKGQGSISSSNSTGTAADSNAADNDGFEPVGDEELPFR
ncbi:type IA DNA topoisomerase [Butyrivibrio sp. INlla16]|uniref:topoisomerase C-terminal repeat-containing protein n=1 Tax=Butyrivibrio sp. INlla16 TaxID=1520807 RepID=UPI00088B6ABF|nr:type IA DNA topoisomerase [Butyrivibrio sp. INlla16]SDB49801.1 hypothetical protein SAMN02910263_02471 [Butyrivibrio sp. INlla16]